jgi:hypothetical protein
MWLRLRLLLRLWLLGMDVGVMVKVEVGVHAWRWVVRLLEVRLVERHDGTGLWRR